MVSMKLKLTRKINIFNSTSLNGWFKSIEKVLKFFSKTTSQSESFSQTTAKKPERRWCSEVVHMHTKRHYRKTSECNVMYKFTANFIIFMEGQPLWCGPERTAVLFWDIWTGQEMRSKIWKRRTRRDWGESNRYCGTGLRVPEDQHTNLANQPQKPTTLKETFTTNMAVRRPCTLYWMILEQQNGQRKLTKVTGKWQSSHVNKEKRLGWIMAGVDVFVMMIS